MEPGRPRALPSNVRIRKLEKVNDQQIEDITHVLMEAFYDHLGVSIMLDGLNKTDTPLYHDFMRMQAEDLADQGHTWVAEEIVVEGNEAGRIVGLSGWYPPSKGFKGEGFAQLLARLPGVLQRWWTAYYLPRSEQWTHRWVGETAEKDSWFMHALVVLPEYQGKGLGRALFRAGADTALADGKRALWHTTPPENVPMYESWGAVIRGSAVFVGVDRKAVFPSWILELLPTTGD